MSRASYFLSMVCLMGLLVGCKPTEPAGPPEIISFSLDKQEASPGETVTANWVLSGTATSASILLLDTLVIEVLHPDNFWMTGVPQRGELTFTVPKDQGLGGGLLVSLNISPGGARADTSLRVRCDYPWFFTPRPGNCPSAPVGQQNAAMRKYEHGVIVKFEKDYGAWILVGNPAMTGRAYYCEPQAGEGIPYDKCIQSGPTGTITKLGSATTDEITFASCTGTAESYKSHDTYFTDADGRILEILSGMDNAASWQLVNELDGKPVKSTGCK
jgi:hypothetical protein